jgi:methylated-DNA-[protein]-cysteine S-methyltransferase
VGQAVKANPLLILVPCHRVVGAKDDGGWSAFGSPGVKARLLALEAPDGPASATPRPGPPGA